MQEKIVELEKLIDSQVSTYVYVLSNYIGDMCDINLSGGNLQTDYMIKADGDLTDVLVHVPVIGPHSVIKPLRLHVMTQFWDYVGVIWVFQDARTSDGIIKYYPGDNPNYKASRAAEGNNSGGGYKRLKVICTTPGDLNSVRIRLF
ncbi:hypothetical protein GPY51_05935 [Photorhabdus laumondii subsp. laumondii]|uniref:Photorhabdus luminescens subsp. laumondii TTO1 complete genome segment 13/17 n=2 Tax=Photorhabdus laumondii subsp. laumondii TaxID=141679 RepID=Q7N0T6_PHOLL|nr:MULTISPECIES: hypothetical protein [Photorhabdus]AWK43408.1 hypothetical protein A4R40_18870 [Photorhabdus laumondii subsp. laumondii]AXG44084.1 hypothetical protein PluDJC_18745 [Photorhabdus laumondii subsp. laumondii]AXG48716.1 hypothetical protein PluTT01m_19455 [Photorhabdus laumondii subsp. laumondii]KTL60230.1 hypothetical protein AA106_14100 [Photorhabdus laumondii subsp. laumondii]MCC8383192.1 hypothetical protein [Photorhabdus laumondii]